MKKILKICFKKITLILLSFIFICVVANIFSFREYHEIFTNRVDLKFSSKMLNVIERQIILYELGYYNRNTDKSITNDNFDGIMGLNFKKALKKLQKNSKIAVDGIYGKNSDNALKKAYLDFIKKPINWKDKVLANFNINEFKCPCCGKILINKAVLYNIQALRHYLGTSVIITSGYRCNKYNIKVGGVSNSRHKEGKAIDFYSIKTNTMAKRTNIIDFYINYFPNVNYAYQNGYGRTKALKSKPVSHTMGNAIHIDVL